MHTEDEAKTKWCPMIRADNVTPLWHEKKQEPGFTPQAKATCIGSACMAWQWNVHDMELAVTPVKIHEAGIIERVPPAGEGWQSADRYGFGNDARWFRPMENQRGYCGLAGRPEEAS